MIKIMTDMSADITKAQAEELGISVLPFYINFGEESILADIDYTPQMFYEKFKTSAEHPATSQATPDILEEMYRAQGKENQIVHITIPGNSSGIVNTARMISAELIEEGFDITIVESSMFSYGTGANVVAAAKMAQDGATKAEIVSFLEERFAKDKVYFIVDDLSTLKKGGRIKATTMVVSAMLDIKPILWSNDGMVEAFAKVKGSKRALAKLVDCVEEKIEDPSTTEICLLNADCPEKTEQLKKMIQDRISATNFKNVEVGPIITCHAGVGVFGVYFRHK